MIKHVGGISTANAEESRCWTQMPTPASDKQKGFQGIAKKLKEGVGRLVFRW